MAGLLAGLDALVVALVLLAAVYAIATVFRPLLVSVLSNAPAIGGWLSSNVDSGLASFQSAIMASVNASLGLLSSSLGWLATWARAMTSTLGDLIGGIYNSVWTIANVTIPNAVGQVLQQAESLVADARGYALGLVQTAEADAQQLFTTAETDAVSLVQTAEADAQGLFTTAESDALQLVQAAEQQAGQLFQTAETDAQLLVTAAEDKAQALVEQARADLSGAVAAVEHDVQQLAAATGVLVADTTATLGGDIAAARAALEQEITGVDQLVRDEVANILNSTPWAALVADVEGGEAWLQSQVMDLVALGYQAIQAELGDAAAIRAKYGPQVRAALAQLTPPSAAPGP